MRNCTTHFHKLKIHKTLQTPEAKPICEARHRDRTTNKPQKTKVDFLKWRKVEYEKNEREKQKDTQRQTERDRETANFWCKKKYERPTNDVSEASVWLA